MSDGPPWTGLDIGELVRKHAAAAGNPITDHEMRVATAALQGAAEAIAPVIERLKAENELLCEALAILTVSAERDRREPDKILCHVASARRRVFDATLAASPSPGSNNE